MKIENNEWLEISNALEPHHAVFYKVWQMGKPIFDERISTAAVQFDTEGKFVVFLFNPEFWKKLNLTNKLFVICHESLHVILNHGLRSKDAGVNHQACNVAMDIVINHSLVRNFGFNRDDITDSKEMCWVDTIFPDKKPLPRDDETFEFYYNLFEKIYGDGGMGDGEGSVPKTLDDHGMWSSSGWGKVIEKLNEEMSKEEKESLKTTIEKHFQKPTTNKQTQIDELNSPAGTGTGTWTFAGEPRAKKQKKWETVIKNWMRKHLKEDSYEFEQWIRVNRRLSMLPKDLMLSSDMEIDDLHKVENKIDVWFFLDTSGSCWSLKDRFFAAAESLPENKFNVRLFCFDTSVVETNLVDRKIYGGGGTSFVIIENFISSTIAKEGKKYPDAVWVLTDGYGDQVNPIKPENWYWFLTQGGTNYLLPKKSNIFNLNDYV